MEKSEYYDSSIAEEQHINCTNLRLQQSSPPINSWKLASFTQIRNAERQSQIQNKQMIESFSVYLRQDLFAPKVNVNFLSLEGQNWFIKNDKRQQASGIIQKQENSYLIKIPITNVGRKTILMIELGSLKKRRQMVLQSREQSMQHRTVGYRYTFEWAQNSLHLRVWVKIQGQFKVWKEMQVPLTQNRVVLQIQEFNNQQTDVKVNDFLFHLVLKMAYSHDVNYHLSLQNAAVLQRLELRSFSQGKHQQDIQNHCSNECKII